MSVKIELFSLFKLELDNSELEYEIEKETDIESILDSLDQEFDGAITERLLDQKKILPGSIILVNGHNVIHLQGLKTLVQDGDRIVIFPPSAGG